jgi:hypothetical protein
MNRQETAAVLGMVQASWPQFTLTEPTVVMWAKQLADMDPRDGRLAIEAIIRSDDRPPSISRFRRTAQGFTRRRLDVEARERGLGAAEADRPLPAEQNLARARALREALRHA